MRKLLLLAMTVCLVGAATAQKKKVAVVTMVVDKKIGIDKLGQSAQAAASVLTLADDPSFDLKPVIDNFNEAFINDLAPQFPFEVVHSEAITGNSNYKNHQSMWVRDQGDDNAYMVPQGDYKILQRRTLGIAGEDVKAMLGMFPDVDGVMFIYLDFEFTKISVAGMGAAQIRSRINMVCWNQEDKKVFDIYENGTSKKKAPLVAGFPVMKPEKIQPMCASATERLINDLGKKMKKIVSKTDKKL